MFVTLHHSPPPRRSGVTSDGVQPQPQMPQAGGFLGDLLDSLFANFHNVRVNVDTFGQGPM